MLKKIFYYETKIGKIGIAEDGDSITDIFFYNEAIPKDSKVEETPLLKMAAMQLQEYFNGSRTIFDLPLAPMGTEFQRRVWAALEAIPYGETRSYKQIGEAIGQPRACRAVGMANNRNPISIIIPCHRVIGANGKLIGYGGGLGIKEMLLDLERENAVRHRG